MPMLRTSVQHPAPQCKLAPRPGVVYLFHFSQPLGNPASPHGQAGHYLGWTNDLRRRLAEHRNGWGAAITMAAVERGITLHLVRIWAGPRALEPQLKRGKNLPRLCPLCRDAHRLADQLPLPLDFADLERDLLCQVPPTLVRITWEEIRAWRQQRRAPPPSRIDWGQDADADLPF